MARQFKKTGSKIVYKNPWIKVRQDAVIRPDGKKEFMDFWKKRPAIG